MFFGFCALRKNTSATASSLQARSNRVSISKNEKPLKNEVPVVASHTYYVYIYFGRLTRFAPNEDHKAL